MSFRAFISIDLARIREIEDLIISLKTADPTLKVVDPGQIHITLKFLGETPESKVQGIVDTMKEAAQGIEPFEVQLKGAGAFPTKNRIRVIWVGMNDTLPMGTMATRLDESLSRQGFERERRPFAPHLTMARTKVEASNPVLRQLIDNNAHNEFGTIFVDRIRLKKSILTKCGPQYSTVEEILLS
ncbi:MAG: RNA 2',3'-cyclic phosphodiesterase [Methanomassiliicoccus sp.]|nr:RNA 2',3'-cyclic phosphodiesterase [Methanomassiliicoccus sp.]